MKSGFTSRRSFLQALLIASASANANGTVSELAASQVSAENDADYWKLVRQQFSFTEKWVPMNAANLCPTPRAVWERISELTTSIDKDCSFNNRRQYPGLSERSRQRVAAQLGVSGEEIALVRNTSEANNIINAGFPLGSGDEVILWNQNHPTNNVAWDVRAKRYGFHIKRVSVPPHPSGREELVDPFAKAFTSRTKVLALTHLSNLSGLRLPVREIAETAHRKGIYVHVDGAQTWGALNVDLRALGCDSYAASAHKWLAGPKEVGLLFIREQHISKIWPSIVAPGWGDDEKPDVEGARKFESFGQRDDPSLAALGTAADFHRMIGGENIEKRVLDLAAHLKDGLRALGAKLITPASPRMSAGVSVIEVPAENRQRLCDQLYEQFGIAGSTTGGLRLCPHVYNTIAHVERAIEGVESLRDMIAT